MLAGNRRVREQFVTLGHHALPAASLDTTIRYFINSRRATLGFDAPMYRRPAGFDVRGASVSFIVLIHNRRLSWASRLILVFTLCLPSETYSQVCCSTQLTHLLARPAQSAPLDDRGAHRFLPALVRWGGAICI
jgi:hypothetical protein